MLSPSSPFELIEYNQCEIVCLVEVEGGRRRKKNKTSGGGVEKQTVSHTAAVKLLFRYKRTTQSVAKRIELHTGCRSSLFDVPLECSFCWSRGGKKGLSASSRSPTEEGHEE